MMDEDTEQKIHWISDGHILFWDEDGPWIEHPDQCPSITKTTPKGHEYPVFECIPGIEDDDEGIDEETYKGDMDEMPWYDPYMVEGKVLIEWYYSAYWVPGLPHGDEYHCEFGWREARGRRRKKHEEEQ